MAGQKLARFYCETDNHMEKSIASGTQMTEMSANETLINLLEASPAGSGKISPFLWTERDCLIFFPPTGIDSLLSPMRHVPRFFASLRMTRPAGRGHHVFSHFSDLSSGLRPAPFRSGNS